MSEKLCVFCDHLSLNLEVEYGYYEGEVYPHGNIRCLKGYWKLEHGEHDRPVRFTQGELAKAIQEARTCADYSPPKATK